MRNGQLMLKKTTDGFVGYGNLATLKTAIKFDVEHNEQSDHDNSPNTPAFRLIARAPGGAELDVGAAWKKVGERGNVEGKTFFSMTLDDPSFDAPLNVTAFPTGEDKDGHQVFDIVWSRPKQRAA